MNCSNQRAAIRTRMSPILSCKLLFYALMSYRLLKLWQFREIDRSAEESDCRKSKLPRHLSVTFSCFLALETIGSCGARRSNLERHCGLIPASDGK